MRSIAFITRKTTRHLSNSILNECLGAQIIPKRYNSNEAIERRSHLFNLEKQRQTEAVGRIEKIEVKYVGLPKETTLIMNKDLSTPYDCARHLGSMHVQKSALALLDDTILWDMHRPLTQNCKLELLHFMIADPLQLLNKAFWRTCSFALGAVISSAFKDAFAVQLHSFPAPDVRSGSFVYDAQLTGLTDWQPTQQELRSLSASFVKLARQDLPVERLRAPVDLALAMFENNEHKTKQIPDIAKKDDGYVTLYKVGDHIDISRGPMIGNLGLIGRATIAAVYQMKRHEGQNDSDVLYRFQGVSLPTGIIINHVAYKILEERAAKLNPARSPLESSTIEGDDGQIASRAVA